MYHYFLVIFLLIINSAYADMQKQLIQLHGKLNTLLQTLQSVPSQIQRSQPTLTTMPTGRLVTPTPLWDSVIDLYNHLQSIPVKKINNIDLRNKISEIYKEWYLSFANLSQFEIALQHFLTYIQSLQAKRSRSEPQEFITLAINFDKLLGQRAIEPLKTLLNELTRFSLLNQFEEGDTAIALAVLQDISHILDTLAQKVTSYENIIDAQNYKGVQWLQDKINYGMEGKNIHTLHAWWAEIIANPIISEGLNRSNIKKEYPLLFTEENLNSGYIYNAITALRQEATQPEPIFQPTPVQPVPRPQSINQTPTEIFVQKNLNQLNAELVRAANTLLEITDEELLDNLTVIKTWVTSALANSITAENNLNQLLQDLAKISAGPIIEPASFAAAVQRISDSFNLSSTVKISRYINNLTRYASQIILNNKDKQIIKNYFESISTILSTIYTIISQWGKDHAQELKNYTWGNLLKHNGYQKFKLEINQVVKQAANKNQVQKPPIRSINGVLIPNAVEYFNKK